MKKKGKGNHDKLNIETGIIKLFADNESLIDRYTKKDLYMDDSLPGCLGTCFPIPPNDCKTCKFNREKYGEFRCMRYIIPPDAILAATSNQKRGIERQHLHVRIDDE